MQLQTDKPEQCNSVAMQQLMPVCMCGPCYPSRAQGANILLIKAMVQTRKRVGYEIIIIILKQQQQGTKT